MPAPPRFATLTVLAAFLAANAVGSVAADSSAAPRREASVLETQTEGLQRDLGDGVTLFLAPGTRVERQGWLRIMLANGEPKLAHNLQLVKGRLDVDVRKLGDAPVPVVVRAPRKITGLFRLGRAVVKVQKGAVTVAVLEGDAMAAAGNQWRQLAPGFVRTFTARDPDGQPRPIVAAVEPRVETRLLIAMPNQRVAGRATWPAVPGASSYEVSIDQLDASARKSVRQVSTTQPETSLDDLLPGNYEVSVRAVDDAGIGGRASPPLSLRVIGVELPDGARVSGGAIRLARDQRVRFTHAQGLEFTYDRATHFVPVPESTGLNRGRGVIVRLRERGQTDEARLTLAPNALTTDVQLGPQLAKWPRDTVTVRIRVHRGPGSTSGQEATLRPEVTINGRGVMPNWTHRDDLWRATVPPPSSQGPWVVRVRVFDASGDLTGRASLEVAQHSQE